MKRSKKQVAEIMQVYNAYWDNYLKGHVEAMKPLLDKTYTQVGSAEGEVFFNKKDAVQFLYDTIDQVMGKLEMRNRKTQLEPAGDMMLIQERCDLYALAGKKWIFYSRFRASTLMIQKKEGWKITHQHSSFPDNRTGEGDNISIKKIEKENQQLREAVKRRTIELEQKSRDQEIETALERVRTIAMGMNKPEDMLEVCRCIAVQLEKLGTKEIRNVQTAIFYEGRGTYMNYEYYAKHKKTFTTETSYTNHKVHKAFAAKMLKGKGEFFTTHIKGKKVKEWVAYQKTTNVFIDRFLKKANSLNYYWYSLGPVALGMSTYAPLSKEDIQLFNRFRNVFELCYRRYMDIEQAIAQAREAQIETALEKVRSRTMAMQRSEELSETAFILYQQFRELGEIPIQITIGIIDEAERSIEFRITGTDGSGTQVKRAFNASIEEPTLIHKLYKAWKAKERSVVVELAGKELQGWVTYRNQISNTKDDTDYTNASRVVSAGFFSSGLISITTLTVLPEETIQLLKRFAAVFDQAYTRFLDLQKAEAQSKEAQIEAALERVRSRSVGMQRSDELKEVIKIVYQQLRHLKINLDHAGFVVDYTPGGDWHFWIADEQDIPAKITHPYFESVWATQFNEAKEKGTDLFVTLLNFEEKNKFYTELLSYVPGLPQASIDFYLNCSGLAATTVVLEDIGLYIENFLGIPYTNEDNNTLMRFGKVFQQTYTRFLDLQKAEAQVKEAKIEAALERVRSRSLAMHHSSELSAVVDTLLREFNNLEFTLTFCIINLINEQDKSNTVWAANPEAGKAPESYYMKFEDYPFHYAMWDAWKAQKKRFVYTIEGEEKKIYDQYLYSETEFSRFPQNVKEANMALERYVAGFTFFKYSGLQTVSVNPISEEDLSILERFGRVFEQSYTRFLDLQKAEVQAREGQIQLAMERVRARTMAMQRSDELQDVAILLFQQVKELGIEPWASGFNIWQEGNDSYIDWVSTPAGFLEPYMVDLTSHPVFREISDAKKRGEDFHVFDTSGKALEETYALLISFAPKQFEGILASGIPFPNRQINHYVYGEQVGLMFITPEPCPEAHDIFKRFGKVFEQTYTRFLDLQKAEAQAREAKIEAALERVRSKTMAMHNSQDVGDTVATLFEELVKLGVYTNRCGILINSENSMQAEVWTAKSNPAGKANLIIGQLDLTMHPLLEGIYKTWKNKERIFTYTMIGADLKAYYKAINDTKYYPTQFDLDTLPAKEFHTDFYFAEGSIFAFTPEPIPDEATSIFERFAKVFGQTYRRYLDLQKAEAQAREAEIQLALERARSQSMTMQHSAELDNTLRVFHEQVLQLGIRSAFSFLWLPDEEKDRHIFWAAWAENNSSVFKSKAINYPLDRNEPATAQCLVDWKGNEPVVSYHVPPTGVESYFAAWSELIAGVEELKPENFTDGLYYVEAFIKYGCFGVMVKSELREEEKKILNRFAAEFESTYTRFLDLQKAEAQAREAQIETALERVRSRTMAMQHSEDLTEVANLLFQQVQALGVPAWSCGFNIWEEKEKCFTGWMSSEGILQPPFKIPLSDLPTFNRFYESRQKGELFYVEEMGGDTLTAQYQYMRSLPGFGEILDDFLKSGFTLPTFQINHVVNFLQGNLIFITSENVPEAHDIFKRFAKVFEQTYTRFLDLQKAEAQAREAQIEVGLERVRARTMAMHSSDDVSIATATMFTELEKLNTQNLRGGILNIKPDETMEVWSVNSLEDGRLVRAVGLFDMRIHPFWQQLYRGWVNKDEVLHFNMSGKDKADYISILDARRDYLPNGIQELPDSHVQAYFFGEGAVWAFSMQPHSEEDKQLMKRFASVFSLTFRRYQDLKKAEAQAREAQIEAALEKVRSRTMAMHNSEELLNIIIVVSEQLQQLEIKFANVSFGVNNQNYDMQLWMAVKGYPTAYHISWTFLDNPGVTRLKEAQKQPERVYSDVLNHDENNEWLRHIIYCNPLLDIFSEEVTDRLFNTPGFARSIAIMNDIFLVMGNYAAIPYKDEENSILKRFANVFEQAYKRFLDLQKAETQAKEATLEAALERVRARAMAMQTSEDVVSATSVLFGELDKLDIKTMRCGILLLDEAQTMEIWTSVFTKDQQITKIIGRLDMNIHPLLQGIFKSWMQKDELYSYKLIGDDIQRYYSALAKAYDPYSTLAHHDMPEHYCHVFYFEEGGLYTFSEESYSEEIKQIIKRFTSVFSLTFKRYQDLKKGETQAKDAIRQATLDRIRADIASMRTVADLDKITPLIWNELIVLGVPFIRCGVFIMNDSQQLIHTFLSTPDGKAIAAFHLPYDTPGNFAEIVNRWHNKQIYIDHWGETEFIGIAETLVKQGAIATKEQYLNTLPNDGFYLHFLPFLQGMLYVGNTTQLGEEEIKLIQSVADAFSTAYARYEDFNKLEAAKQQVDKTLTDLKQTQAQLVQSEKMASLGELTAGIAHEIQNPLNFVNNFSEVNKELIEEMQQEIDKGNYTGAKEISNNIKDNEEKINHHGKRADAIVKGMLQHSRSTSATKEPTDINKLADEYLRLAYHGLRAKDKSFNATMKTDFDENIGNISIIPQDIGRVILNLITNAFYAVKERQKEEGEGFKPMVSVETKRIKDKVEISVSDNGGGIPKNILDKIFQPFFTTKPTGQGTGLGLSLAYDIVKVHGGELKVETGEGQGTSFIIQLPVV